jgi:hypothetical protein
MGIILQLSGKKFGKLTVLQRVASKNGNSIWLCLCDCGKSREYAGVILTAGKAVSCGCGRVGKNSSHFSGFKDISAHYWGHVRSNAAVRGLEFSIGIEEVWKTYENQNKKCALSGLDIVFSSSPKQIANKFQTASIDRIDNSIGYIPENIQILHKDINKMKNIHSERYFVELCLAVSKHRG